MASLNDFIKISSLAGVDQYILVDRTGKIAAHQIKDPQKAAQIVLTCGQNAYVIGKKRFKHVIFSRENRKNIFIFPIGNYYLGVVKQDSMDNDTLIDNIVNFLKAFLKRKQISHT